MASYNRVVLLGNLTRDPDLRYIPSGTGLCEIGLAVNDRKKDDSGNWVDEAHFFDVILWGRSAEVASEYLTKGSPVLIEGRLKQERWEKDGQKRSKVVVVGERMQLLGGRKQQNDEYSQAEPEAKPQPAGFSQGGSTPADGDVDTPF